MKGGHSKRVERVRDFATHNKVFVVIAIILIAFLIFSTVSDKKNETPESSQTEQNVSDETQSEDTGWRFYPIDLVVLGVGGGICSIMIIRERRKAKEGLN